MMDVRFGGGQSLLGALRSSVWRRVDRGALKDVTGAGRLVLVKEGGFLIPRSVPYDAGVTVYADRNNTRYLLHSGVDTPLDRVVVDPILGHDVFTQTFQAVPGSPQALTRQTTFPVFTPLADGIDVDLRERFQVRGAMSPTPTGRAIDSFTLDDLPDEVIDPPEISIQPNGRVIANRVAKEPLTGTLNDVTLEEIKTSKGVPVSVYPELFEFADSPNNRGLLVVRP